MAMPICKLCGESFLTRIEIDGVIHNLCNRKYCLQCSPFKEHNTKQLEQYLDGEKLIRNCETCGKSFECTPIRKRYKKQCDSCITSAHRKRKKLRAVNYKGGCCEQCGYNKSIAALCFHHKDPTKKKFTICYELCRSWESLQKEIDKCILLCANCHAELHYGIGFGL